MVRESLGQILVTTILSGNFVLAMFLGIAQMYTLLEREDDAAPS